MRKIIILLLTSLFIFSCSDQQSEPRSAMGNYSIPQDDLMFEEDLELEPPRTAESMSRPIFSLKRGSKIIKNGQMNFEVNKLEWVKDNLDSILVVYKGYYEREQYHSYGNSNSYSLQLRILNSKFDSLVFELVHGIGNLKSKNITAKDVTKEYVDLNIRLETNLAYLDQYKEILKQAKSVKEILEVKEKIRNIEVEIESKKGRLNYIDNNVEYSTLSLEITEMLSPKAAMSPTFGQRITIAFTKGIQGFLNCIIELVNLWPFVLILVLLFLGRKPILDTIKRRSTTSNID